MPTSGLDIVNVAGLIREARSHILLYAPPYGRFATSEVLCDALEVALARPGGASMTALSLPDLSECGWMRDFMELLRPQCDTQTVQRELDISRAFLRNLAAMYAGRVDVLEMQSRPNLPILLVDDHILFGQFCHSRVLAPEGFWNIVHTPVEALFAHEAMGTEPYGSATERAAFRIVSECAYALRRARISGEYHAAS